MELFLRYSELKGLSPQTIKFHEQKINRFLHFAKSRKISPELIEDFKEYLLQTNSPATINTILHALRAFCNWGESQGFLKGMAKEISSMTDILENLAGWTIDL